MESNLLLAKGDAKNEPVVALAIQTTIQTIHQMEVKQIQLTGASPILLQTTFPLTCILRMDHLTLRQMACQNPLPQRDVPQIPIQGLPSIQTLILLRRCRTKARPTRQRPRTPKDPGSSDPGQGSKKRPHDGSGPDGPGGGKKGCVKGCGDGSPSGEDDSTPKSTGEASGQTNAPGNSGTAPPGNVPPVSPGTGAPNEGPAVSPATPQSPTATCCDNCSDSPKCDMTWSGMFLISM